MSFLRNLAAMSNAQTNYDTQQLDFQTNQSKKAAIDLANALSALKLSEAQSDQQTQDVAGKGLDAYASGEQTQQTAVPPVALMPQSGQPPSNMQPAPNPPLVQQASIGAPPPPAPIPPQAMQQVPMPGAAPLSQVPQLPASAVNAQNLPQGWQANVPPPPLAPQGQMPPTGQPAQTGAAPQGQTQGQQPDPKMQAKQQEFQQHLMQLAPEERQNLMQGLQGPQANELKQVAAAVKQANPNASPAVRMKAVAAVMGMVNDQSKQLLNAYKEQIALMKVQGMQTSPDSVEELKGLVRAGNIGALTRQSAQVRNQVFAELAKEGFSGEDAAQAALRFHGGMSEASAAGRQTGGIAVAGQGFNAIAPEALKASAAVPRSSWLAGAKLGNWLKEQSNDPAFAEFQAFNLGLVREYARSMGGTVSAQNHAEEVLGTAKDQKAYSAAVQALSKEIGLAEEGGQRAIDNAGKQSAAPHISGSPPADNDPLGILQ